jgi:hypothetical protein
MQGHTTSPSGPTIDTSFLGNGSVLAFETCLGDDFILAPRVGSLIWIEFQILTTPPAGQTYTSKFDISTEYPDNTWIWDPDLNLIPITPDDATYTIIGPTGPPPPPPPPEETRICVDPPEIIDPTMLPSSTFTINITIDNVADLAICEFNLSYATTILSCYGVTALRVQGQIPTVKMTLDDEAGFIWVRLKYSTPITTDIPIPIAKIEFHVDALGASSLDLHDTQLLDSGGNPIAHQALDGYFATLIRDVAITNVVPQKSWVYQGQTVKINVTAKNEGNTNETFNVFAKYDGNLIGNFTVKDLPPGNETTIIFTWNTTAVIPCHNYTISAEAETLPFELDTIDNTYTDGAVKVRFLGDLNGDGKVDGRDITELAIAFASYGPNLIYPGSPPHPKWNPDADINGDNVIDGRDMVVVAKNFGKTCLP